MNSVTWKSLWNKEKLTFARWLFSFPFKNQVRPPPGPSPRAVPVPGKSVSNKKNDLPQLWGHWSFGCFDSVRRTFHSRGGAGVAATPTSLTLLWNISCDLFCSFFRRGKGWKHYGSKVLFMKYDVWNTKPHFSGFSRTGAKFFLLPKNTFLSCNFTWFFPNFSDREAFSHFPEVTSSEPTKYKIFLKYVVYS